MSNSTEFPDALAVTDDKTMIPIITLDLEEVPHALEFADVKTMIPITLAMESGRYDSWAQLFKVQARVRGVIDHILPPTDPTEKARVDKEKAENLELWKRIDAVVLQWIYATVSIDILTLIFVDDDSAAHAWESVANLFQGNTNSSGVPALVANHSASVVPGVSSPALVVNQSASGIVVPGKPLALVANQSASVVVPGEASSPALVANQSASMPGPPHNVHSNGRHLWPKIQGSKAHNVNSNGRHLWPKIQGSNARSIQKSKQISGWKPWCRTTTSARRRKPWYKTATSVWWRRWRKLSWKWRPVQLLRGIASRPPTTAMVLAPFRNALTCLSHGLDRGFNCLDRFLHSWLGSSPDYWGPAPHNSSSPMLMQPIARTSNAYNASFPIGRAMVRGHRGNSQITRARRGTRTPRQPQLTYDVKPPVQPQLTYHVKTERHATKRHA